MSEPSTEERLERALAYMAFVVRRQGTVYLPLFGKIEQELMEFPQKNEPVEERTVRLLAHSDRLALTIR